VTAADFGYAKPRELLFLLLSSPPLTREQLGVALWPDQSRQQLGNALHTALRGVRRALGDPGCVVYAEGRYTFDRPRPPPAGPSPPRPRCPTCSAPSPPTAVTSWPR